MAGLGPSVPSGLTPQPTPVCNQAEDRTRPAAGQTPTTARSQPVLAHQRLDISARSSNFQSTTPLVARQLTLRRRSDTLMVGQKGGLKFLYTDTRNLHPLIAEVVAPAANRNAFSKICRPESQYGCSVPGTALTQITRELRMQSHAVAYALRLWLRSIPKQITRIASPKIVAGSETSTALVSYQLLISQPNMTYRVDWSWHRTA